MYEIKNWTYGIYDVISLSDIKKGNHILCNCKCRICGCERQIRLSYINNEQYLPKECKHLDKFNNQIDFKTSWTNKRLKQIFSQMRQRCYNQNNKDYCFYGAKGIHIYDTWLNNPHEFESWAFANGYTDSLTIDRIDSSKDYCPENCRWISLENNSRFKSTTNYIEVNTELKSGRQWSKDLGYGHNYINIMLRNKGLEYTKQFIQDKLNNRV